VLTFRAFATPTDFLKRLLIRYAGPPEEQKEKRERYLEHKQEIEDAVAKILDRWCKITNDFSEDRSLGALVRAHVQPSHIPAPLSDIRQRVRDLSLTHDISLTHSLTHSLTCAVQCSDGP